MNVLLTGGAGYIGSTISNLLLDRKHDVTIIDNLSTGNINNIPKKANFIKADISNRKTIFKLLKKNVFDVIIHLAAYIDVEESVKNPNKYILNNYQKTKDFVNFCILNNHKKFIFSSTAAVYAGNSKKKVKENSILKPISPYAISKLKSEKFIMKIKNIDYIILRYFNVAGADIRLRSGLISKKKSTHLIKKLCENYLKSKEIKIFGSDYPSKDGTAIRDYIHVVDLALAHIYAANYLNKNKSSLVLNCGYGHGYSVKEVIDSFNSLNKKKLPYSYSKRRMGDIFSLVADNQSIKKKIGWKPKYDSLRKILKSSIDWEKKIKKNNF